MSDAGDALPLGVYLDEWLQRRAPQLRPATQENYRRTIGIYLAPHLGEVALGELDRLRLERFFTWLQACGGQRGGRLSVRTVAYAHMVLASALKDAVLDGLLEANPARGVRLPRYDPQATELAEEPEVWTPQQARAFLAFVDDHDSRALWHLAIGTGARRGELLGLRWRDVDLDAARIDVRRSLSMIDGVARLLATKTANRRVLAIGASVVEALRRHAHQQQQRRAAAARWDERWDLVFTDDEGAPVAPGRVTYEFRRLVRQAPVPVVRLHDLRHFHATALLQAGVSPKVVSQRLGHSKVAITLDVYAHVLPAMDTEAAEWFDTALQAAADRAASATEGDVPFISAGPKQ